MSAFTSASGTFGTCRDRLPMSVDRGKADLVLGPSARYIAVMTDRIRIHKHEAVPKCGSYEVRFPDGRESRFFYFDDVPGRRIRPELFTGEQAALGQARAFARAERDKASPAAARC
jgi:hypothetical protein